MGVGFDFQIFLEVTGQRRQRLLLAGKQSAIWILDGRLRGWEINTVESKPGFQSLLFGRRPRRRRRSLDGGLSRGGRYKAAGIRTTGRYLARSWISGLRSPRSAAAHSREQARTP